LEVKKRRYFLTKRLRVVLLSGVATSAVIKYWVGSCRPKANPKNRLAVF